MSKRNHKRNQKKSSRGPSVASVTQEESGGSKKGVIWTAAGLVVAALGVWSGWAVVGPSRESADAARESAEADQSGEERDQRKEEENQDRESGPPIEIVPGTRENSGPWESVTYAFPERTYSIDGTLAAFDTSDFLTKEYVEWLEGNNAIQVYSTSSRFTIKALHETTVVIQDMRVVDLECGPATSGTLILPPALGGPGVMAEKTKVVFDLAESPEPMARESITGDFTQWSLGDPFFSQSLYLEGGAVEDQHTFDVYFLTGGQDCEFGFEVLATGNNGDEWVPVELREGVSRMRVGGDAASYESVIGWRYEDPMSGIGVPEIDPADTSTTPLMVWGTGRDPDQPPPPVFEEGGDPLE